MIKRARAQLQREKKTETKKKKRSFFFGWTRENDREKSDLNDDPWIYYIHGSVLKQQKRENHSFSLSISLSIYISIYIYPSFSLSISRESIIQYKNPNRMPILTFIARVTDGMLLVNRIKNMFFFLFIITLYSLSLSLSFNGIGSFYGNCRRLYRSFRYI